MSQYMLLLYATEVEGEELAEREAEIPIFLELNRSLEQAGLLVAAGRLHPTTTATTVTAISGEAELTDGPFAITKEALAGYCIIDVATPERAEEIAARWPDAQHWGMEIRALMHGGGEEV